MSIDEVLSAQKRRREEERIKKQCEPYEKLFAGLRNSIKKEPNRYNLPLIVDRKPLLFVLQPRHILRAGQTNDPGRIRVKIIV